MPHPTTTQPVVIPIAITPSPSTTTTRVPSSKPNITSISTPVPKTTSVTPNDVKKHNKLSDCWIIINNKAYDVTTFIDQHPGGLVIIPFCGKDATKAFDTIKDGRGHSRQATQLLDSYYVGDVQ